MQLHIYCAGGQYPGFRWLDQWNPTMSSRLERLLGMEHYIRKGTYPNVEALCQMFGVQPRTVYDDLRLLKQMVGLTIRFDRSHNGYYIENPEKALPSFELTDEELLGLALSKELLSAYSRRTLEPLLASALDKIVDRNKQKTTVKIIEIGSFLRVMDAREFVRTRKIFIELCRAWSDRKVAAITYGTDRKAEPLTGCMEPRCLALHGGVWYLIAVCQSAQALRVIPAQTILEVKLSEEQFSTVDGHDVDGFVKLLFSERCENLEG